MRVSLSLQAWVGLRTSLLIWTLTGLALAATPVIQTPGRSLEAEEGFPVSLVVEVSSVSSATYQWYRGNRGNTASPVAGATNATLSIPAEKGITTYWLKVSNSEGSTNSDEFRVVAWERSERVWVNRARFLDGKIVGVGVEDIYTSQEGRAWTKMGSILMAGLEDIAFGNGLYLAVGNRGTFSSTDLVHWTPTNTQPGGDGRVGYGIAYGNGTFVTTGFESFSTTDGLSWKKIALSSGWSLSSVVFANNQFFAVGTDNSDPAKPKGLILVSTDGVTWTPRTLSASLVENFPLDRIEFLGGKFLATGKRAAVLTSGDSVTWSKGVLNENVGNAIDVGFVAGRYVLSTNEGRFYLSTDALTWSAASGPAGFFPETLSTLSDRILSFRGGTIHETTDGVTWNVIHASDYISPDGITSIAWGNGKFIGLGFSSAYESTDGRLWRTLPLSPTFGGFSRIAHKFGWFFLAEGPTPGEYLTSVDGYEWETGFIRGLTASFHASFSAGSRLFMAAGGALASSVNGNDWTVVSVGEEAFVQDIAFGNGTYVCAAGRLLYSADGLTWTASSVDPFPNFSAVTFGNGLFVAISNSGLFTSIDGKDWTLREVPTSRPGADVHYTGGKFFFVNSDGLFTSPDGILWTHQFDTFGPDFNSITEGAGMLLSASNWIRPKDDQLASVAITGPAEEVPASSTVTLSATATGLGTTTYQWFYGYAGDTRQPIIGANGAVLVTTPLLADQRIWVRMQNLSGTADSGTQFLRLVAPPKILIQPTPADVDPESYAATATLSVRAESKTAITYQWFLGQKGDTRNAIKDAIASTLIVAPTTQATRYWVRVRNAHGTEDSESSLVTPWRKLMLSSMSGFFAGELIYARNQFLATGYHWSGSQTQPKVARSPDGQTWTTSDVSTLLGAVAYGNDRYVALPAVGGFQAHVSVDGINWELVVIDPEGSRFANMAFNGGLFLALGENGRLRTSQNSTLWSPALLGTKRLSVAAHGKGRYVVIDIEGGVFTSADGAVWSSKGVLTPPEVLQLHFDGARFLAFTANGAVVQSSDGETWSKVTSQVTRSPITYAPVSRYSVANRRYFAGYPAFQNRGGTTSTDGRMWGESLAFGLVAGGGGSLLGMNLNIVRDVSGYRSGGASALFVALPEVGVPQIIQQPESCAIEMGESAVFAVAVSGGQPLNYQWRRNGVSLTDNTRIRGTTGPILSLKDVLNDDQGVYDVVITNTFGSDNSVSAQLSVTAPILTLLSTPADQGVTLDAPLTLTTTVSVASGSPAPNYQWLRNGKPVVGANAAALTLSAVRPEHAGVYTVVVSSGSHTKSESMIVGPLISTKVVGAGTEVGTNIAHPNGNIYDQILLQGTAVSVTADPGQVLRLSYIDLSDDIVQVEFSGAGTLTLTLDNASGPATPLNYVQPTVSYMKGHAGIVIVGANETTHVAAFSVGRITAVNQSLFKEGTAYDGMADLSYVAIQSSDGRIGGARLGNTSFSDIQGTSGVIAPRVNVLGPLFFHDIRAIESARPVLLVAGASDARVLGGDLAQVDLRAIEVSGLTRLNFAAGTDSHGRLLPAQPNRGKLTQEGVDVTAALTSGN